MMRSEYPRPSFLRNNWENLNGKWEFQLAEEKENLLHCAKYDSEINVPFCIESELSGIGCKDFVKHAFYRRKIVVNGDLLNGTVLLHFGAVDNTAIVYVNKKKVAEHRGGYCGFSSDITGYLVAGENAIDVEIFDDTCDISIPSGKQSDRKESYGCLYTRTTGIWQTVWLEYLGRDYVDRVKIDASADKKTISIKGKVCGSDAQTIEAALSFEGKTIKKQTFPVKDNTFDGVIELDEIKLWDIGEPALYDLDLTLKKGTDTQLDNVRTYTGFRKFEIDGNKFRLNGREILLKQVLDQGFYEKGIYTAPDEKDLLKDIELAMSFGFNGARLHEKVFEERYLYYADKKGFLVWGEFPNWGCNFTQKHKDAVDNFINEWKEVMERDYNHPCIIGWCPLNEAWKGNIHDCDAVSQKKLEEVTKFYGGDRVFIGSSGGKLYCGQVHDYHTYIHSPSKLRRVLLAKKKAVNIAFDKFKHRLSKDDTLTLEELAKMPFFYSEYGGLSYMAGEGAWGYNRVIKSEEEFIDLFINLTKTAVECGAAGFCYTQLYDVEQERNGLLTYGRGHKLSDKGVEKIRNFIMNL